MIQVAHGRILSLGQLAAGLLSIYLRRWAVRRGGPYWASDESTPEADCGWPLLASDRNPRDPTGRSRETQQDSLEVSTHDVGCPRLWSCRGGSSRRVWSCRCHAVLLLATLAESLRKHVILGLYWRLFTPFFRATCTNDARGLIGPLGMGEFGNCRPKPVDSAPGSRCAHGLCA